jgi:low-density lipoprotein receptor-related protein 4
MSLHPQIYFTDAGRRSIEVSELDGTNRKVLVWQDLEAPRAIAIDYEFGYLFFSDWGTFARIERSDMDGEKRSRIVTNRLGWPNGLSVDKAMKNLYWTDAKVSAGLADDLRKLI